MASEEIFPGDFDGDDDDAPDDGDVFREFFGIAINALREGGVTEHPEAQALTAEYVRRNIEPLEFDA
jgi:hypothetical protein